MQPLQLSDIDRFAAYSVLDEDGKAHLLANFWKSQRAALVFVRQFG